MSTYPSAIITGASSGIGKATAMAFAKAGYALTLIDIAEHALDECVGEIKAEVQSAKVLPIGGDLADINFALNIAEKSYKRWQRIDVLINNAAWRTIETMRNITPENWKRTTDVCLMAPAFLCREVAKFMEQDQTPGTIINISSVMSKRAGGYSPAYVAAKGGIESLTRELAALYGPSGIRVVSICPGNVRTPLNEDLKDDAHRDISKDLVNHVENLTPLNRSAGASEIAEALLWLASAKASFITGTSIVIDGGFSTNFNSYQLKKLQFPKEF